MPSCADLSCTNNKAKNKDIHYHRFPLGDKVLLEKWLEAIRRPDLVAKNSTKLCNAHFKPEDYDRTANRRELRKGTVPSIFNFSTRRKLLPGFKVQKTLVKIPQEEFKTVFKVPKKGGAESDNIEQNCATISSEQFKVLTNWQTG